MDLILMILKGAINLYIEIMKVCLSLLLMILKTR